MTIDNLEKELKMGKLNSIYLLYGEELFLLENCLKKIKGLFGECVKGINYILIDEQNVSEIINDIETPSFGYEKKLIIAKNTGLFKKEGKKKKRMEVFSMLNVIERIQTDYPDVEIVSIGEQDFVVQLLDAPMAPKWLETLKVVVMVVVIFLGAAFTIMAFNNDVSVGEVFNRFYQQVMGKEKPKVSEIEIFYCLGLAVGILVFFNHIGKKKITSDPTPIQVEMRKYEQDVDMAFIENAGRKGHEHDVS